MNRRNLIGGAAAIGAATTGLAGTVAIVAQAASGNPDAELIRACAAYPALCEAYGAEPEDDGPAYQAWAPVNAIICEARPVTVAGVLALAQTTVDHIRQWGDGGEFHCSDAEAWGFNVVVALVRLADSGLAGGAP